MLKSPVYGSEEFLMGFCHDKLVEIDNVFEEIMDLPSKHKAMHLLRHCASFCKVVHLARTSPLEYVETLMEQFDEKQKGALEKISGTAFTGEEWEQAQMPVGEGGFGLRSAVEHAHAAYVASRGLTEELVEQLVGTECEPPDLVGVNYLGVARVALADKVSENMREHLLDGGKVTRQKSLSIQICQHARNAWIARVSRIKRISLEAYSQPWADGWLRGCPSDNLDTCLSNGAFRDAVKMRLCMQMFNGDGHCPLCRMVIGIHGHHVFACMCGGDKVLEHNEIRNEVHRVAKVAGAQPELEAGGLLGGLGWPGVAGRRPADTLLVAARGVRGTSRRAFARVAFDFAVTSPFSPYVLRLSSESGLAAAQQYASYKRRHLNTQEMCEAAGIGFEPIVFESTGGLEPEAVGVLNSLLAMVADASGKAFATEKERLMQRVSLILVRSHHRALCRRRGGVAGGGVGEASARVAEAEGTLESNVDTDMDM